MKNSVGQNIPHDAARGHVTGKSVFVDDRPFIQGELHVDYVASPVACGRLRNIETAAALNIPGVVGIYTFRDLAHNAWGPIFRHEPILVEEAISYAGQVIAVIAAASREALHLAKNLVRCEIEALPPVLSIAHARANEDFIGSIHTIRRGDVDAGFGHAAHVISGTFVSEGQEQFYLESQAAAAVPGESGTIEVHSSTQHPTEVQHVVAEALGLGCQQVTCTVTRMGGGFGGKETQAAPFAVMAALVVQKTGRAARIVISKDDDMRSTGKRHPFETEYKVGVDADGRILALRAHFYSDGGAFADLSTSVMERAMLHVDNAYFIENAEIRGAVCRTNHQSHTAFRGFGGPQGVAVIENAIEEIAMTLGKDPLEIRRLNCYRDQRNVTPYGQSVENNTLPEILDKLALTSEYKIRRQEILEFNATETARLRGISLTMVKFGISFTTRMLNQGNALVNLHRDGTVQVATGATEMGQGVNTKIAQVVAGVFGIAASAVRVMPTSTDKNSNTSPTAASSGADLNCAAALNACDKIKNRLKVVAANYFVGRIEEDDLDTNEDVSGIRFEDSAVFDVKNPGVRMGFSDLLSRAYLCRVALQDFGFYKFPEIQFDKTLWQGRPFFYYTNGAAVSEVEIDRFTGELKVRRVDILMDLGDMINPGIDRGQTTGAFVQGMGWVTSEKLVYDAEGILLTHSPTTYKIPNIQDTPRIFNVSFLENHGNTINVHGSKASGEPPLLLGISVWTAAKMALASTRPGWVPKLRIPATAEEVLTVLES